MENRTVRTLQRQSTDRVPVFEHVINGRFIEYAIQKPYTCSLEMDPADHIKLAEAIHMDLVTLGYISRVPGTNTRAGLANMKLPEHADFLARVREYHKALTGSALGLNTYVHGPFDSTYLSMGYENFFYTIHDDLKLIEEMMDVFTEDACQMCRELIKTGVTTIELVDDIGYKNGLFIDPKLFRALWYPRMEKIAQIVHAADMPCFFHSDGDVRYFIEMLIDLGIQGLNPLETQCNDIAWVKQHYGRDIVLMGNLDIGGVLASGTPQEVRRQMSDLLAVMMPGEGYIAMSSSSVADCVIPENYMAMVETVMEKGFYRN